MNPKATYWRMRFARWGRSVGRYREDGYSLLLPVPGDLPVFLELALAVCRGQDPAHRVETFVLPDQLTPAMRDVVAAQAGDWPGRLRLLPLPAIDRAVLPRLADAGRNYGAQVIQGVRHAAAQRVLLHDADLFLMDSRVHADQVELAQKEDLDVLGVSPAWDPWFAARGQELVATWEQVGRVDWYQKFPPHRHFGHDADVDGERHTFDVTFWPQLHSPASSRAVGLGLAERVVHFNYTIGTYRAYRASTQRKREPFHDKGFRILLIRLFVELFGGLGGADPRFDYGLPSLDELAAGMERGGEHIRVLYGLGDADGYRQMRAGLAAVVHGPWSTPERAARCEELLARFDAYFAEAFGRP